MKKIYIILLQLSISIAIVGCTKKEASKVSIEEPKEQQGVALAIPELTKIPPLVSEKREESSTDIANFKQQGVALAIPKLPKIPPLVSEKREESSTDIANFKLLGFRLGEPYVGTVGYDWAQYKQATTDAHNRAIEALRPDLLKGGIFSRLVAPDEMGEIGLILSPKSKTILNMVYSVKIANQDLSPISKILSNIAKDCSNLNIEKFITAVKESANISADAANYGEAECDFSISGSTFRGQYWAALMIGRGPHITYRKGEYNRKTYKPANLIIKVENDVASIIFGDSNLSYSNWVETGKGTAFFAKTGKTPEEVLRLELMEMVQEGDPVAVLAAAKTSRDPKEKVNLLSKIEGSNIEAKVLAGQVYLEDFDGVYSARGKLGIPVDEAIKAASVRLKEAADAGSKDGKILLARMYERGYGVERNPSISAQLLIDGGGQKSAEFFNFCQRHDSLKECSAITEQVSRDKANRLAAEIGEMHKFSILVSCTGPAKNYVSTVMMAMASNPMAGIQAINAQSRFCQSINLPLQDKDILLSKNPVATGSNGARYFIAQTKDPSVMVGLVRRPD
jgi:hypothetical protein